MIRLFRLCCWTCCSDSTATHVAAWIVKCVYFSEVQRCYRKYIQHCRSQKVISPVSSLSLGEFADETLIPAMRKSRSSRGARSAACRGWLASAAPQSTHQFLSNRRESCETWPSKESRLLLRLVLVRGVVNTRTLFSQERFNYETRRRACRRRNRISMVTWCRRNCWRSSRDQHRLSELRAVRPGVAQLPRATLAISGDATPACREVATSAGDLSKKLVFGPQDKQLMDWLRPGIFNNWWGFAAIVSRRDRNIIQKSLGDLATHS